METMNKFSMLTRGLIPLLCVFALTFFGCGDNEKEPEVVKQLSAAGALSFEAAGGTKTFTVAGATSVANAANSGTITATFPATAASAPAFVAITNIIGVPSTMTAGTPLTLSGTVAPSNATNQTITWSLGAGSTAAGAAVRSARQVRER